MSKIEEVKNLKQSGEWQEPIMVHIVPHSYNTEFFTTVDQYFPEQKEQLLQEHFDKVFNSVVKALRKDATRTFTHYETRYFSNWFERADDDTKFVIQQMIWAGKFEFVNGGWEQHQDACPHYADIMHNIFKGHQWLYNNFWIFPRVAWSLDMYGHSSANARLYSESGIEAIFISHIDPAERQVRMVNQTMEFLWRPNFYNLGKKAQLFAHVIYDFDISPFDLVVDDVNITGGNYKVDYEEWENFWGNQTTDQWWFDIPWDDDWWWTDDDTDWDNDNDNSTDDDWIDALDDDLDWWTDGNIRLQQQHKITPKSMRTHILQQAKSYKTPHLLMMVGANTNFEDAELYYHQLDQIIARFNLYNDDIRLTHSTLSFLDEAIQYHDIELDVHYYDLMTLSDKYGNYYTGSYSNRENFKDFIRSAGQTLAASNKLLAMKFINNMTSDYQPLFDASDRLNTAVAQAQNSDGVSGLSEDVLANKIAADLYNALQGNLNVTAKTINEAAIKIAGIQSKSGWKWCLKTNSTYLDCPIASQRNQSALNMMVAVFNPATHYINHTVVAVPHGNISVRVYNVEKNTFDEAVAGVVCDNELDGTPNCQLYVRHTVFGNSIGFLQLRYNSTSNITATQLTDGKFKIENDIQYLQYQGEDENLGSTFLIQKKIYMDNFRFGIDLRYYPSYQGFQGSRSGAAIFKPATNESLRYSKVQSIYYQLTPVVSQITIVYNDTETQETALVKAKIYKDLSMMEWEVALGPIPESDHGKEVIVVFETDSIDQQDVFFTDSNGLHMEPRMVNFRPRYYSAEASSTFNVSVNYYPITSAICIRDMYWEKQMTVMTTRTQGGSAMQPGAIELMQSRRLNYDDISKKGVFLRTSEEVTATYYLQLLNRDYEVSEQRWQQLHIDNPPLYFFSSDYTYNARSAQGQSGQPLLNFTELASAGVPPYAKIEYYPLNNSQIYFRLENLEDSFDHGRGWPRRPPVYVQVDKIAEMLYQKVYGKNISSDRFYMVETSLSANEERIWMDWDKVQWKGVDDDYIPDYIFASDNSSYNISLDPQRLRSFFVDFTNYWWFDDWEEDWIDEDYWIDDEISIPIQRKVKAKLAQKAI